MRILDRKYRDCFYFCIVKTKVAKYLSIAILAISSLLCNAQICHFWDGIEEFDGPTDVNPIMEIQIDYYFDSLVSPLPDSICSEINRLMERNISTELRDFILWHLLNRYQSPDYMTQDQVFVFLYDNYFSKLDIKDLSTENLSMIADKAETLRQLQLFNVAPNITGKDTKGTYFDLSKLSSQFIVLLFYDHDCALCNETMNELTNNELTTTSIVAIDTNPDQKNDSNTFINIKSFDINEDIFALYDIEATPLIYVLDSDKHIIAKKIRAEQIKLFTE